MDEGLKSLCPETLTRLSEGHKSGKLPLSDFLRECTYFALTPAGGWDEVRARPMPSMPAEIVEYGKLSKWERKRMKVEFWAQAEIYAWFKSANRVYLENRGTKAHLNFLRENLISGDARSATMIDRKLKVIEDVLDDYERFFKIYPSKQQQGGL